jgi:hypothetical protein
MINQKIGELWAERNMTTYFVKMANE